MNTNLSLTRASWLRSATVRLEAAGIGTARLDCLVLLEDVLQTNRAHLLAEPDTLLSHGHISVLEDMLAKRTQHVPLAYIRGKTEFYGRDFIVNEHVLQPRPESETMIDLLKNLELPTYTVLADIGAGSGALGITAALELELKIVYLHDIDQNTLNIAEQNAKLHNIDVQLIRTNLLENTAEHLDVLLCNLPYVPDSYRINTAATHEPAIALFGGSDGLDLYRELFVQVNALAEKPGYIFTESLPPSHEALKDIATAAGYQQIQQADFIQLFTI